MQQEMKKLAAVILAILMLCPVCSVMASEAPLFHTIKEALGASEGYASINETDHYVILILERDGKYIRVVTMMDDPAKELYQAALTAEDSSAFELFDAYAWDLPVSYTEIITAMPLGQAELDALEGKTIQEIMQEWQCRGFVSSGSSGNDGMIITLDYGLYQYSFEVDGQGDMERARVKNGEVSGFSRAAFDLSCHADGTF